MLINENVTKKTIEFKVEARGQHMSICLRIKKREEEEAGKEQEEEKVEIITV